MQIQGCRCYFKQATFDTEVAWVIVLCILLRGP